MSALAMKRFWYWLFKPFQSWRNKYFKAVTMREGRGKRLVDEVLAELSDYTGESEEAVSRKGKTGPQVEAKFGIFRDQSVLSRDAVEDFYKGCRYYIYELPIWNAERNRPEYLYRAMRRWLEKAGCRRLLDFGGGTGDLCLKLAEKGYCVSYCDIGVEVARLARWRFERRDLDIPMYSDIQDLPGNGFDAVISLDCFEHIKELPETVRRLAGLIRPGGLLITADAFGRDYVHLKENEKYQDFRVYNEMLRASGLEFQAQFAQYYAHRKRG